jgi:hypothetical protein
MLSHDSKQYCILCRHHFFNITSYDNIKGTVTEKHVIVINCYPKKNHPLQYSTLQ